MGERFLFSFHGLLFVWIKTFLGAKKLEKKWNSYLGSFFGTSTCLCTTFMCAIIPFLVWKVLLHVLQGKGWTAAEWSWSAERVLGLKSGCLFVCFCCTCLSKFDWVKKMATSGIWQKEHRNSWVSRTCWNKAVSDGNILVQWLHGSTWYTCTCAKRSFSHANIFGQWEHSQLWYSSSLAFLP